MKPKNSRARTNNNYVSPKEEAEAIYRNLVEQINQVAPEQLSQNVYHLMQRTAKAHRRLNRRQKIKGKLSAFARFAALAEKLQKELRAMSVIDGAAKASCGDTSAMGTPAIQQR